MLFKEISNSARYVYATILISIVAISFISGFFFSKNHWQAPLIQDKEQMASIIKESNAKLDMIKSQASADSKESLKRIKESDEKIDSLTLLYDAEKKKRKVIEIFVPGAKEKIEVSVENDGSTSCSNLGNDFADAVNGIIDEANR